MKNIRVAKDGNTVYLSVSCETDDDMNKVIEIMNKVLCPEKEQEPEVLKGACPVKAVVPEPVKGAEKVEFTTVPIGEEDKIKLMKKTSRCPICGSMLKSGSGGNRCTKCLYQDKVYGTEITDDMILQLKENGRTDDMKFNSPGREGHLEIINGKFKFVQKKKSA